MGRNGSHRSAGYEIDTKAGVGEKNNLSSRLCAFNETVDDGAEQNGGNGVERGEKKQDEALPPSDGSHWAAVIAGLVCRSISRRLPRLLRVAY